MHFSEIAQTKPTSAYTIFCGVKEYDESILDTIENNSYDFKKWEIHDNPFNEPSEQVIRNFNNFYYESFINSIFPDFKNSDKRYFDSDRASKTKRFTKRIDKNFTIERSKNEKYSVRIEYLDLFIFPENIAIYSFKCILTDHTFDQITFLNNYIRNQGLTGTLQFLADELRVLDSERPEDDLQTLGISFGNKLKTYSIIEHDLELPKENEFQLLYDLATCSPIGSGSGENKFFQPSEDYIASLKENNRISIFDNWTALGLFDTFTALFQSGALNKFVWENAYFNLIFLHSIYVKHYLFRINKKFFLEGSNKRKLEDDFYNFDKYFNIKQISFNFLPQIIYNKVRKGFEIDDELEQLKSSIERANSKEKGARDKKINDVLTVIALLTVFSIIWDVSEWINKLFFGDDKSYNILSGSLTGAVLIILVLFLFKNYKKKK